MKFSIKQLLSLVIALAVVFVASSCGDDEPTAEVAPTLSAPAPGNAVVGTPVTLEFSVTAAAGFASAIVDNELGGTATAPTGMSNGDTNGTLTVEFTPTSEGAGAVTIVVTDANGNTDDATAVVTIEAVQTTFRVSGQITADATWATGSTIILEDRVTVVSGVTLTIEAGVVIKGEAGAGANASALLIARGATLNANGTAQAPIIFTTIADEIQPGQIASPNLTPQDQGFWGGLIILGNAPISADSNPLQIEGIPPSDTNGLYGGTTPNDNSGTIRYISIRHGGQNIGEGNEINGLTLGGVGSRTTIEYVEIIGNADDGIEPFGGSVDVSNILVWNSGDDSFDCDQAYSGTIDNFIGILGANSDHGMELDGPEGADITPDAYTLINGSIKGKGSGNLSGGEYADLRSDAKCNLENIYFFNFAENSDFELDNNGVATNYLQEEINLTNIQFNVSGLEATYDDDGVTKDSNLTIADIVVEKADSDDGEQLLDVFTQRPLATSVEVVTTPTVGANKAAFASWTWADAAGELDDFN